MNPDKFGLKGRGFDANIERTREDLNNAIERVSALAEPPTDVPGVTSAVSQGEEAPVTTS